MWQRNDTGHVVDVAAYPTDKDPDRRPFTVGPGEVVDFPEPLGGFTETDPPAAEAHRGDEETKQTKTRAKRAGQQESPEGDEPQ